MASLATILKSLPSLWPAIVRAANLRIIPGSGVTVDYRGNTVTIGLAGSGGKFASLRGAALLAKITGKTGCGFGYYTCDFYRMSGEVLDESTALTNAKLAVSGDKLFSGFCFGMQEVDTSTNALADAANTKQLFFPVEIVGASSNNGSAIGRLFGNAIWIDTCPDTGDGDGGTP